MTQHTSSDQLDSITDTVNQLFHGVDEGFVNRHNEPAMTTPTIIGIAEVVVVGSTICLIC